MMRFIKYKFILLVFSILFCLDLLIAQHRYDYQWIISHFNKLDFTKGTLMTEDVTPSPYIYNTGDNTSSICDKYGDLLMITGGCRILNKEMQLMKNGDSINMDLSMLWCKENYNDFPLKQSALVLPDLLDSNLYYAFNYNLEDVRNNLIYLPIPTKLLFSTIDARLDNNKGGVIKKRQIVIKDTLNRGFLTATLNQGNNGWWILIPKYGSDCFYVINQSNSEIKLDHIDCGGPVKIDSIGTSGFAAFSPNSKFYSFVLGKNTLALYKFDNNNGGLIYYKYLKFPSDSLFYRNICFSPNSKYLYLITRLQVYQFDLESDSIQESLSLVGELNLSLLKPGQSTLGQAKLGPDGKIYIAGNGNHTYLSVINKPNCKGTNCEFVQHDIELKLSSYSGMQNSPHYYITPASYNCDSLTKTNNDEIENNSISLSANLNYIWIQFDNSGNNHFEYIKIFDINGKELQFELLEKTKMTKEVKINLPNGVYFISFFDKLNHSKIIKKFVI